MTALSRHTSLDQKSWHNIDFARLFFFTTGETNRTNASNVVLRWQQELCRDGAYTCTRKNILSRVYIYKNVAVRWRTLSDVEKEIINCHVCLFWEHWNYYTLMCIYLLKVVFALSCSMFWFLHLYVSLLIFIKFENILLSRIFPSISSQFLDVRSTLKHSYERPRLGELFVLGGYLI